METNKDLILRSIKYFSDFLIALTKENPIEKEDIDLHINDFTLREFNLTLKSLLEKESFEIVKIIENSDIENIKDFTDLMFFRFSIEKNLQKKIEQSKKILELYHIYQNKSAVYSLEIQSKINILKNILI